MKNYDFRLIFIFLFIICFKYSDSQIICSSEYCTNRNAEGCSGDPTICDSNKCKPKYVPNINDITCHYCSGISDENYYTIDSNGDCLINVCRGDKIIEKSRECTYQPADNLFKLGDFYYNSKPDDTDNCENKI